MLMMPLALSWIHLPAPLFKIGLDDGTQMEILVCASGLPVDRDVQSAIHFKEGECPMFFLLHSELDGEGLQ